MNYRHVSVRHMIRTVRLGMTIAFLFVVPLSVNAAGPEPEWLLGNPVPPPTTPGDENWTLGSDRVGSGMNDSIRALAFDGSGNLYAGGYFTTAGAVSATRIA